MKSITLYCTHGNSDKVYQLSIVEAEGGYLVNYQNGKRGSTLRPGTRTKEPVPFEQAEKLYNSIVKKKLSDHYTESEDGTVYVSSEDDGSNSGIHCQLLNTISKGEAKDKCNDNSYAAQEKMDGERRLVKYSNNTAHGINKKGKFVSLPEPIATAFCDCDMILDGEIIGDILYVFDILRHQCNDLAELGFEQRYALLHQLIVDSEQDSVKLVHAYFSPAEKRRLLKDTKAQGKEGVVFKLNCSPYVSGRPISGGDHLKYKHYKTASFIVSKINTQRSVGISVVCNGKATSSGNVSIPINKEIPSIGDVIEVRYLYAIPKSNALHQPTYKELRNDVEPDDCKIEQLEYKRTA